MSVSYSFECPFCHRHFASIPPSIASCPHCNSLLRVDLRGVTLIREGIRPTPSAVAPAGGAAIGAIIGALIGGGPGAVLGGLIGFGIGAASQRSERQG